MKKLLAGTLVALTGILGMATTATAAEIPPTPECSTLNKRLIAEYFEALDGDHSTKKLNRAKRGLTNRLTEAGCLSDAAPILENLKSKPNTEQCVAAAKAANAFWNPATRETKALLQEFNTRTASLQKRMTSLEKRLNRQFRKNVPMKRLRPLLKKLRVLSHRLIKIGKPYNRRYMKTIASQSHDSVLVFAELVSKRCVSFDQLVKVMIDGDELHQKNLGPAAKIADRHRMVILMSSIQLQTKYSRLVSGMAAASSGQPQSPFELIGPL